MGRKLVALMAALGLIATVLVTAQTTVAAAAPSFRIPGSSLTGPPTPPPPAGSSGLGTCDCAFSAYYRFSVPAAGAQVTVAGSADGTQPEKLGNATAAGWMLDDNFIGLVFPGSEIAPWTGFLSGGTHWIQIGIVRAGLNPPFGVGDVWVIGGTLTEIGPGSTSGSEFVAMGDSYSSGEGIEPFISPSDTNGCHRSSKAYSQKYRAAVVPSATSAFKACSGATLESLTVGMNGEPGQFDALGSSTKFVTLTLGGNDVGFAPVIADCVWFGSVNPFGQPKPVSNPWVKGAPNCATRNGTPVFWKLVALQSATPKDGWIPQRLRDVYTMIHAKAPNAKVRVLEYPNLFPSPMTGNCRVTTGNLFGLSGWVTQSDASWLRRVGDTLNQIIENEVSEAKASAPGYDIKAVRINYFDGHDICNHTSDTASYFISPFIGVHGSFHPTELGQTYMALNLLYAG